MDKNYKNELIFGDRLASISDNSNSLAYKLSEIVPSLQYLEAIGDKKEFLGKTYSVKINNLKICSHFMTPSKVAAKDSDEYTLMIPISGICKTTVENKDFIWKEKTFAYCKPRCEGMSISLENRSLILIDISPQKFNEQAKIMLGENERNSFYNFENPSLVALNYHGITFDVMMKQICKMIDSHLETIQSLEKAKLDELVYRTLVMMFLPQNFYNENINQQPKNRISTSTIKLIKEFENENYFSFMTLSDLEKFLDLSTRNLQLLFQKNFGLTPTQFLREQKLKYSRKVLLESEGLTNITQVATEMGFLNFSQFSKYYKEYHGVLPSETKRSFLRVKYK